MTRTYLKAALIAACAFALTAPIASADAFTDNFEGGSLSSTNWLVLGHGQIVTDPLNASNHVLSFSQLATGGDIFSVPLNLAEPQITLSFDYLGIDSSQSVGTNTGGFVIIDVPNSFAGYVLLGTSSTGGPALPDMENLTPGVWHHISVTFPSSLVQAGNGSKITFEEWATSPNAAGNAYFDNINMTTAPEPASALLLGGGLAAAGLLRRRAGRKA